MLRSGEVRGNERPRSEPRAPAKQQRAVEQHGQPEEDLKGALARLVAEEPLPRQRPRPAAAQGEEVQGALAGTLTAAPGSEFVETVDNAGDDAEQAVDDDDDQRYTSYGLTGGGCSGAPVCPIGWDPNVSDTNLFLSKV